MRRFIAADPFFGIFLFAAVERRLGAARLRTVFRFVVRRFFVALVLPPVAIIAATAPVTCPCASGTLIGIDSGSFAEC